MEDIIMPNWCFNHLRVTRMDEYRLEINDEKNTKKERKELEKLVEKSKKQLKEFKKVSIVQCEGDECSGENKTLTFEGVLPMPEDLNLEKSSNEPDEVKAQKEINIKKYGFADWYEWRCHNWGTKWNAGSSDIAEDSDDELIMNFETAWAPPEPWMEAASKMFPLLDFEMHVEEESDAFYGRWKAAFGIYWDGIQSNHWIETRDNKELLKFLKND